MENYIIQSRFLKIFYKGLFWGVFIGCCFLVLMFYFSVNYAINVPQDTFFIAKDEALKNVSYRLEKEGYIFSDFIFRLYIKITGEEKNIKAGNYIFSSSLSIKDVIKIITANAGNGAFLVKEGDTLREIELNLRNEKIVDSSFSLVKWQTNDFLTFYPEMLKSAPVNASLEGFLFPDSYNFTKGLKEQELIKIFLDNFYKKFKKEIFYLIENQQDDFYKILVMASLLEKEIRSEEDKRMVADLLWRRLKSDLLLQVDATICYAQNKSFFDCQLIVESFKIDSPYNTYLYKGLPPTPISNPGLESIKAALNPLPNNYWYYLTDRKTGETIFSKTYEEHLKARAKYL